MYYMQYLFSLCQRRQWPEPLYETYSANPGFSCVVRVNNREYYTAAAYESEVLARENAAMRAYLICRNFSVTDGYVPGYNKGGVLQGMPVAIGTERRSIYGEDLASSTSSGSRSGGSSPETNGTSRTHRKASRADGVGKILAYGSRGR